MAWTFAGRDPEYCPSCGEPVAVGRSDEGPRAECESCGLTCHRNPVPNVRVTVVDGDRALLVRQTVGGPDEGWAPPGGHLLECEEPRAGAARELEEETGVAVPPADLVLVGVGLGQERGWSELGVGFAVDAARASGTPAPAGTGEVDAARYVPVGDLPSADRMYGAFDPGWVEAAVAAVGPAPMD